MMDIAGGLPAALRETRKVAVGCRISGNSQEG
jgi:hypothetical protein